MSTLLFGINISTSAAPGADPVAEARKAEELGFEFVSANDHPCGTNPTNEVWTMLALDGRRHLPNPGGASGAGGPVPVSSDGGEDGRDS